LEEEIAARVTKLLMDKIVRAFYSYLYKFAFVTDDYSTLDVNIQNNLHRGLCSLGWVCAYNGDDMSMSETLSLACDGDENLVSPSNLSLSNCGVACFKLFKLMLSKSDAPTRCSAVRALSGLFTGLPRMMLKAQEIGMIEEILDPKNEFEVSARPRASAAPPPQPK